MEGENITNTINALKQISLASEEENKMIDVFGFVTSEKSLDFSDMKKSLIEVEVEVMQESPAQLPAELLQSPAELLANVKDENARKNKARKERKKRRKNRRKNRRRTTPYIDPSVVDVLFEIMQLCIEHNATLRDDPECARVVSDISKEDVKQKLAEHNQRKGKKDYSRR